MPRRGINLGRCKNKYLIIDIFFFSAEQDARKEAEAVLWLCSRGHKKFLARNFDWYPRNLEWKSLSLSLMEQSGQVESMKQPKFLFDNIRINGKTEVKKVTRIFTASIDGWEASAFHLYCDGRGPTLCLIRSSDEYLSAGFASIAWTSDGTSVEDASACVFALTDTLQVFKTKNPEKALYHHSWQGPIWYDALGLDGHMQRGWSFTKGDEMDNGKYEIVRLPDGKNPLTGSTGDFYTCTEIEVFALE